MAIPGEFATPTRRRDPSGLGMTEPEKSQGRPEYVGSTFKGAMMAMRGLSMDITKDIQARRHSHVARRRKGDPRTDLKIGHYRRKRRACAG